MLGGAVCWVFLPDNFFQKVKVDWKNESLKHNNDTLTEHWWCTDVTTRMHRCNIHDAQMLHWWHANTRMPLHGWCYVWCFDECWVCYWEGSAGIALPGQAKDADVMLESGYCRCSIWIGLGHKAAILYIFSCMSLWTQWDLLLGKWHRFALLKLSPFSQEMLVKLINKNVACKLMSVNWIKECHWLGWIIDENTFFSL